MRRGTGVYLLHTHYMVVGSSVTVRNTPIGVPPVYRIELDAGPKEIGSIIRKCWHDFRVGIPSPVNINKMDQFVIDAGGFKNRKAFYKNSSSVSCVLAEFEIILGATEYREPPGGHLGLREGGAHATL